jgi:hypothetical protein
MQTGATTAAGVTGVPFADIEKDGKSFPFCLMKCSEKRCGAAIGRT